ncbi:MAG: alkaline phosphatase [Massilibacteroides sp.]|nr:alkaline phosphatase [Massilibacteroides sp.]
MSISVNFLYEKNHFYFSCSCFVFILSACSKFQDSSHVIFIALNGLEAYCMDKAEMPITRKLMEQGCSTLKKRSDLLSSSAVNWAAMFMGSSPEIYGYMQWNSKIPEISSRVILHNRIFPTVFQFIRKQSPSAEIGCVYEWSRIKYVIDNRSFNYEEQAKSSEEVNPTICQMAEKYIRERSPDLFAIIFDEPDHIGHQVGYNTEEYYVKVTELDGYMGEIIQAVKDAGIYDNTIFVITEDLGGINKGYGGNTLEDLETPFIVCGKGIKNTGEFEENRMQYAIAVTIVYVLNLKQPQVWNGKPMVQVFEK